MLWSVADRPSRSSGLVDRAAPADRERSAGAPTQDEASFRSFYEATARPLWAYLARSSGDRELADDLLQEAYLRLLRSGFVGEGETHRKNYLYRIASNLVRDHFRGRRPETPVDEAREIAASEGPPAGLRRDLSRILARLDPRERRLVWLAHVEGASHREIGEILEVQEASVRVLLFRARQKLAGLLREEGLQPGSSGMDRGSQEKTP